MGLTAASAGLLLALAAAPLVAGGVAAGTAPEGGCTATAHIETQWGSGTSGGEILTATVVNTSPATATTWTVTWTLASGQRIVSAWNATVTTSGGFATAVNAAYNGTLAPGASTTFGVQLAGTAAAAQMSCGNDAAPPTSGSASQTPPAGADVSLTTADNQTTVTVLVGQTLGVALSTDYVPPTITGTALVPLSVSGGYPTGDPVSALYRAAAPGTLDISSHTDAPCLHATPPCAVPVTLWQVHINVVEALPSGSGQTVAVTFADNLSNVGLHVGDTLVVSLPNDFLRPKATPAGVLAVVQVTGGYSTGQPLVARYFATTPGQVDVATTNDSPCNHDPTPCPSPQVPWKIHITVTA